MIKKLLYAGQRERADLLPGRLRLSELVRTPNQASQPHTSAPNTPPTTVSKAEVVGINEIPVGDSGPRRQP